MTRDHCAMRWSDATLVLALAANIAAFAFEESMSTSNPQPILSPCTGICRLDRSGLCEGCRRTADEIARWVSMTPAERLHLMDAVLPLREVSLS